MISPPRKSSMSAAFVALIAALAIPDCHASGQKRHAYQRAAFMKTHSCPSTGKTRGACPGYIVDHIKPLCAGGSYRPTNMQWRTVAEAKKKDRLEIQECRSMLRRKAV